MQLVQSEASMVSSGKRVTNHGKEEIHRGGDGRAAEEPAHIQEHAGTTAGIMPRRKASLDKGRRRRGVSRCLDMIGFMCSPQSAADLWVWVLSYERFPWQGVQFKFSRYLNELTFYEQSPVKLWMWKYHNGPWDSDHAYEKEREHGRMK